MKIDSVDMNLLGMPNTLSAYVIESSDGLIIIDVGPETCLPAIKTHLAWIGATPSDVKHVLLTHIHLDHAGAAGWWAEQGAHIYVHERGAKHLIDPTRLISSSAMVYGDMMETLWGAIRPVPANQLTALSDNDVLDFGNLSFVAWDTPGHARHHHAYIHQESGIAFTGDVTGVRLNDNIYTSLAGAPPQFDLEAYMHSLDRIENANFNAIYPAHFGRIHDVTDHLARYRVIVQSSAQLVRAHLQNGANSEQLEIHFRRFQRERAELSQLPDAIWRKHESTNASAMTAVGVSLYWEKQMQQNLPKARSATFPSS